MINSIHGLQSLIKEVQEIIESSEKFSLYSDDQEWYKNAPSSPGVYVIRKENEIVYAGETSNIKKKMRDIQDTRNHTLRRKIAKFYFSSDPDYFKTNNSKMFSPSIEEKVTEYCRENLTITYIPLFIGRKEIEEHFLSMDRKPILNSPLKRKNTQKMLNTGLRTIIKYKRSNPQEPY